MRETSSPFHRSFLDGCIQCLEAPCQRQGKKKRNRKIKSSLQGHAHLPLQNKQFFVFTLQPHIENTLPGILALRGSGSTSTDRFVRQDLTCDHSFEDLPSHEEVNGIQLVSFPRLPTTRHIHPFLTQTVTPDHVYLHLRRIQKTPYQGFWYSEVHVLRLRIRFVRQDLDSVISDGFCCFLIWVCVFNDSRWSNLHTFLFV